MSIVFQPTPIYGKGLGCHRFKPDLGGKLDSDGEVINGTPQENFEDSGPFDPIVSGTYAPPSLDDLIDLTKLFTIPVWDQGPLAAGTSFAISYLDAFNFNALGWSDTYNPPHGQSRWGNYYNGRVIEADPLHDSGLALHNSVRTMNRYGAYKEQYFVGDIVDYGKTNKSHFHKQVYTVIAQTEKDILNNLIDGFPVGFGLDLFESFEYTSRNGIVPIPDVVNETMLGGQAFVIVGLDKAKLLYKCRYSWGPYFGDHGYVHIPYDYVLDSQLGFDFGWLQQNP